MSSAEEETSLYVYPIPVAITIGVLTSFLAVVTTALNAMTLLAFCLNKSLRNFGDYFILNLAIADLAIGAFSIPPYIPYLLTLNWTAGKPFCLFWLVWDYVTPAASTFNVCVISIDRYLLVAQPIWYRNRQNTRLLLGMMLTPWIIVIAVYAPSIFLWEIIAGETTIEDGQCYVPYANKLSFLLFGSFVEFMLPFTVMMIVNLLVFINIRARSRSKIGGAHDAVGMSRTAPSTATSGVFTTKVAPMNIQPPQQRQQQEQQQQQQLDPGASTSAKFQPTSSTMTGASTSAKFQPTSSTMTGTATGVTFTSANADIDSTRMKLFSVSAPPLENAVSEDGGAKIDNTIGENANPASSSNQGMDVSTRTSMLDRPQEVPRPRTDAEERSFNNSTASALTGAVTGPAQQQPQGKGSRYNRDRKAARALFILVMVFAVCWLPYEIFALVAAVCPDCIHPVLFETSFWLLWVNSTVNPILYPLLHSRFRVAFFNLWRRMSCGRRQY